VTKYVIAALAIICAILASLAGIFAYNYKDAQKTLESALEANALYAKAIDRLTNQRKIDDKVVMAFQAGLAEINAQTEQTAADVKALSDDPESKDFLGRPLPDNVKRLLNGPDKAGH
jgi:type II secretory pathway pseudopilin PulG